MDRGEKRSVELDTDENLNSKKQNVDNEESEVEVQEGSKGPVGTKDIKEKEQFEIKEQGDGKDQEESKEHKDQEESKGHKDQEHSIEQEGSVDQEESQKQGRSEDVNAMQEKIVSLLEEESGNARTMVGGLAREVPGHPLLWVEGVGRVGLPVNPITAAVLQAAMERAPFGLGEATLQDTQVRDSWQLGPEKLRLENKEFVEAVEEKLVERIKAELGLGEDVEVRAELYKLLLYNPGGHFKAHRDTEKAAGMFGTLILQLPSEFTGGDLVVRHGGEEVVVAMAQAGAATSCVFAAHYSDCEHELREVTSGHRLALVYSLCWRGSGLAPSAELLLGRTDALAGQMAGLAREQDRFCFALSHMYSKQSLDDGGITALKGEDRRVADMLVEVSRKLRGKERLEVYLAQVTRMEEEYGDCGQWSPSRRSCSKGDCYFESYGEMSTEKQATLTNLVHLSTTGRSQAVATEVGWGSEKCLDIEAKEEVINFGLPTSDDSKEEFWGASEDTCSGPTGNQGATMEKWYRRAVIVVWRDCSPIALTTRLGVRLGLKQVEATVRAGEVEEARVELDHVLQVVEKLAGSGKQDRCSQVDLALSLAAKVDDITMAKRVINLFLKGVKVPDTTEVKALRSCIKQYTWPAMKNCLLKFFEHVTTCKSIVKVFTGFVTAEDPLPSNLCKLVEARLEELAEVEAKAVAAAEVAAKKEASRPQAAAPLADDWHQGEAEVPGERLVQEFFRGPRETYRRQFTGVVKARDWARRMNRLPLYATFTPGGVPRFGNAYVDIKKDRAKYLEAMKRMEEQKVARVRREKAMRVEEAKERAEEFKELVNCLPSHKAFNVKSQPTTIIIDSEVSGSDSE